LGNTVIFNVNRSEIEDGDEDADDNAADRPTARA
jgi:hypothetical protein